MYIHTHCSQRLGTEEHSDGSGGGCSKHHIKHDGPTFLAPRISYSAKLNNCICNNGKKDVSQLGGRHRESWKNRGSHYQNQPGQTYTQKKVGIVTYIVS